MTNLDRSSKQEIIIEFKSLFHSLWGVCIGNGKFIDSRQIGKISLYDMLLGRGEILVEKRKLDLLEEKGVLHRNNFMDYVYEPGKPDEIVKTAEAFRHLTMIEEQDYLHHAHDSNQFVLFCRYKNLPQSKITLGEVVTTTMLGGITRYILSRVI